MKKRSTYDSYKDDLYLIDSFLDGRFKLKWVFALDLTEPIKERIANMIKMLVLKSALQLYSLTSSSSECIVELSNVDRCTTDNDSTTNLPSFKHKQLFSGYDVQKTQAKERSGDSCLVFHKKILIRIYIDLRHECFAYRLLLLQ